MGGNGSPVFWAVHLNEVDDDFVLLLGPRPLDQLRVEDLLPPMKALDARPVGQVLGDFLPVFPLVRFDGAPQSLVFLGTPAPLFRPANGSLLSLPPHFLKPVDLTRDSFFFIFSFLGRKQYLVNSKRRSVERTRYLK